MALLTHGNVQHKQLAHKISRRYQREAYLHQKWTSIHQKWTSILHLFITLQKGLEGSRQVAGKWHEVCTRRLRLEVQSLKHIKASLKSLQQRAFL